MSSKCATNTTPRSTFVGPLAILVAATIWGTNGLAQTLAPSGTSSFSLGFIRLSLMGVFLCLACARERPLPRLRHLLSPPVLIGALGIGLFHICFFAAVARIGVALGTVITIGAAPFFTGVFARAMLDEPFTKKWLQSAFVGLVGLSLICGSSGFGILDMGGIFHAIIASISYSAFCVTSQMARKDLSARMTPAAMVFLATLLLAPMALKLDYSWLLSPVGAGVGLYLGGISGALGYFLFFVGLSKTPTNQVPILGLAEPLTACILGCLVLGEHLALPETTGCGLILFSLVRLVMPERQPRPRVRTLRRSG